MASCATVTEATSRKFQSRATGDVETGFSRIVALVQSG